MVVFTTSQIEELLQIIERFQVLFVAKNIGTDILSDTDKDLLRHHGVDINLFIRPEGDYIQQAFRFGILTEALGHEKSKKMKYEQFKKFLRSGQFIPLNEKEKASIEALKRQSYKDIKGLGNKIKGDLQTVIIEADQKQRQQFEKLIQNAALKTIENRKSVRDMVSMLGTKTEDWTRDFGRIADFIMHNAYDEGRAASIERAYGKDEKVYKIPYPGACEHCIRLYLTVGIGSEPKIFKLSDLVANGTNIGIKAKDWKPVLGATHPWCRCTLDRLPPNEEWDKQSKSFKSKATFDRKVQRESKIQIKIGNNDWVEI